MPQPPLPLFVECPHCGNALRLEQEFEHPYSARSRSWTDGKGLGWILRETAYVAGFGDDLYRDDGCGQYFWKSQTVHSRRQAEMTAYNGSVSPELDNIHLRPMSKQLAARNIGRAADDRSLLERALEAGAADTLGREIWIRLRILWLDNNPLRTVLDPRSNGVQIIRASIKHPENFQINADQLLALLDVDDPRELLLMADIFRQLGLFDKATALLRDTAEVFFSTQHKELKKTRAYSEQFRTPAGDGITDLRPRVESLILLARFIAQRALERDRLVRPVSKSHVVFD